MKRPTIGQHFEWRIASSGLSGTAAVDALRSDHDEGLSPEAESYAALWMEATGLTGDHAGQHLALLLSIDGLTYLDGQVVTLRFVDSGSRSPLSPASA